MCIIVAKPKDVAMPTMKTLENCFSNNRDGAGFMYADKGEVHIVKGFMTFDSLKDAISELGKKYCLDKLAMVVHFRIGTQGNNDAANTHPFPVSDNIEDITATRSVCKVGVAHNGIISLTRSYYQEVYSDTVIFVRDYLSLIVDRMTFYKNPNRLKIIEKLADSKLAFLTGDGKITTIGTFINADGVMYSNGTYNYARYVYNVNSNYYYDEHYNEDYNYVNRYNNGYSRSNTGTQSALSDNTNVGLAYSNPPVRGSYTGYVCPLVDRDDLFLLDEDGNYLNIINDMFFFDSSLKIYVKDIVKNTYCELKGVRLYNEKCHIAYSEYVYKNAFSAIIDPNTKVRPVEFYASINKKEGIVTNA